MQDISLFVFILWIGILQKASGDETQMLNFTDIVQGYGYPTEVHEIETEDGFLLDTYRIPYSRQSLTKKPNNYPVLLNHGLMGSAENFLIGGPTKALAYVLADKGFDVWLCNARGTWHSRKHRNLDPDKDMYKFWRFTWHEIGFYDLPATIDYILKTTQKNKLHYIGHSQGTTSFFVMMSERPEYNDKITVMVGMAPSALLGHLKEPAIRIIAPTYKYLQTLAETLKVYELIPKNLLSNDALRFIGTSLCDGQAVTKTLCSNVLTAMSGFTPEQLDPDTIPLIVSTGPAGASVYQALHYAQLVFTGKFIKYDWGVKENQLRYNSSIPPEYKLKNIICPISLMYGEADILVTKEDVEILATSLPNVIDAYKVPYENWSHMDFIWGKDVDKYINKHLIRVLRKFNE